MSIISMAIETDKFVLEREAEYRALATIGGVSFLDCLRNHGYAVEIPLKDAHEAPLKDKKGKELKVLGQTIGNKKYLTKCLEDHGVTDTLCNLTGLGEELIRWYPKWWYEHDEKCSKLDDTGYQWLINIAPLAVNRFVMWNKHTGYTLHRLRTFVDDNVRDAMALIVQKNEIQSASARTANSVIDQRLASFIDKYLPRITQPELRDQMQQELDVLRTDLQNEIPDAFHKYLLEWPTENRYPRIEGSMGLLAQSVGRM